MALLDLVGRRWTLLVLWELVQAGSPLTFRELRECERMSSSVLSRRLAELRDARLVTTTGRGYRLTPLGADLVQRFQPILDWSRVWAAELADATPRDAIVETG